jgi:hypothetical protein
MPEILTESFCERCGTRYTFESAAPTKARKLGKFKTLSKGLKNYVLSDDTSMDEAMAAARSDEERELTSHQLDAFHATFNFCMTCRQYTCGNCWNQVEGRCLTCAPHLGHEIMPAPFSELAPMTPADTLHVDASAWPVSDLQVEAETAPDADAFDPLERLARLSEAGTDAETDAPAPEPVAEQLAETPDVETPAVEQASEAAARAWPVEAVEAAEEEAEIAASLETAAVREVEPEVAAETIAEAEPVVVPEVAAEADQAEAEPELAPEIVAEADLAEAELAEADETEAAIAASPEMVVAEEQLADELVAAEAAPITVEGEVAPAPEPVEVEDFPAAIDARAAAAARRTGDLLAKFRPGQNIDAELAAYEASVTAAPPAEEPVADLAAAAVQEPDGVFEPETVYEPLPEPAPVSEISVEAEPEPEPVAAVEAAPVQEPAVEVVPEPVAEVQAAAETEPEVAVEAEPEVAAEAAPEVAAAAAPEVEAQPPAPTPAPEPVRADRVEQPTWRIVAPDVPSPVTNGHGPETGELPAAASATPPPPPSGAEPQWPSTPEWPIPQPNASLLASRRSSASAATDALWAASARDVVAHPSGAPGGGVQSCSNCGLSLSATARFCRRCGSRQGA